LDAQSWSRIEPILEEALELEGAERAVYLDRACAGEPELRADLEAMLAADAGDGPLDRQPTASLPALLGAWADEEPEESSEVAGRQIGPFQLIRRIGRGGMGVVYEAEDTRLGRRVALKFLPREYVADGAAKKRFLREARSASALRHPGICTIHDIGETDDDRLYIVMTYYEGETLEKRLERGPLPLDQALAFATQLTRALERAHAAGVVHRDMKPANVMVGTDGEVTILDFGIAKMDNEAALTRTGSTLGTPLYMAPEQARGERVDARADLWSLGAMLYEMLTGRRPFRGDSSPVVIHAILEREPEPIERYRPEVPAALATSVLRLLQKDPNERYQDASELLADLQSGTASAPRRRRKLAWIGVAAAAAVALALLVWSRSTPPPSLAVVVIPTEIASSPEESLQIAALVGDAVDAGVLQGLSDLEGIAALTTRTEEVSERTPAETARAFAAEEVVGSRLTCGPRSCQATLLRWDGADGRVLWLENFEVPVDNLQLVVSAVVGHLREGFEPFSPRSGVSRAQLTSADWEEYLVLRRSFESKEDTSDDELLDRLAGLRERAPSFLEVYLLEAEVALDSFHFSREEALLERGFDLLETARQLSPRDPRVLYQLFDLAAETRRWEVAEPVLDELEELDSASSSVLRRRAELEEGQGEAATALEMMRRAAHLRPDSRNLMRLAVMEFRNGQVLSARGTLETLIERSPGHFRGTSFLAGIELTSGSLVRAAELYRQLIERSEAVTELSNLGVTYLLLGRYDEAAESFRKAYDREPGNFGSTLNLADAELLLGRRQAAEGLYREVLDLLDADAAEPGWQQYTVRAQALAHLGREREAVAAAQHALQAAPSHPQAALEVALVYALVGERASAMVNAERAIQLGVGRRWLELPWFAELEAEPEFRALLDSS
jgi:tetratricopeptide (TPR) repeat protein